MINIPKNELQNDYKIVADGFENLAKYIDLQKYSKIVVLTDSNLLDWSQKLRLSLVNFDVNEIIFPAGEENKNLETLANIWSKMTEFSLDRKSLVILLGGGVVGDMGGFASSTFMRGIDFIQIPTSVLSMIDSSVGGKLAIDFGHLKNQIGLFANPKLVLVDTNFLTTLPNREFISGWAEMVKHALIFDISYLGRIENFWQNKQGDLKDLILESISIKSKIVALDFREQAERKMLNFGHTVGHAIEIISWQTDKPLLHGEAVSIGMVSEAKISQQQGFISHLEVGRIISILRMINLPVDFDYYKKNVPNFEAQLESLIQKDKKNSHKAIRWTLLKSLGKASWDNIIPIYKI